MPQLDSLIEQLDRLGAVARLNELAQFVATDKADRLVRMRTVLQQLPPGAYLVGTGPATSHILPLTVEVVTIGRPPSTLESGETDVVDYAVSDLFCLAPREVSRTHAEIVRHGGPGKLRYSVRDRNSSCGTYVNDEQVSAESHGVALEHGDVISLGPSKISSFVFAVVQPEAPD